MGREKRPAATELVRDLVHIASALTVSAEAKDILRRPAKGWLRSIRQLYRLNLGEIAARRNISQQVLLRAEVAEAQERITLKNLRAIADAMGFDLLYCLIPRGGSPKEELDARLREVITGQLAAPLMAEAAQELVGKALGKAQRRRPRPTRGD